MRSSVGKKFMLVSTAVSLLLMTRSKRSLCGGFPFFLVSVRLAPGFRFRPVLAEIYNVLSPHKAKQGSNSCCRYYYNLMKMIGFCWVPSPHRDGTSLWSTSAQVGGWRLGWVGMRPGGVIRSRLWMCIVAVSYTHLTLPTNREV